MNIFVLNTGRCGSVTFIKACQHISNFSCAHESRTHLLGADRFRYPANHIEADNRLSCFLGRLDEAYGDDAFYVHLQRNIRDTAASFVKRYNKGIMAAYVGSGILMSLPKATDPMAVSLDYCHTVNRNIECFLKVKTSKMLFRLENAERAFPRLWEQIGAKGDLDKAVAEFRVQHNASATRSG